MNPSEPERNPESMTIIREKCLRWLARRNHSCHEIRLKCKQKGFDEEDILTVTEELINKKLLDDDRYAREYAEQKTVLHGWGPLKIRAYLSEKGVKKQYIDTAVNNLYTSGDKVDQLAEILRKTAKSTTRRILRMPPGPKRRKKLADFLMRRGFPPSMVYEYTDRLFRKLENDF